MWYALAVIVGIGVGAAGAFALHNRGGDESGPSSMSSSGVIPSIPGWPMAKDVHLPEPKKQPPLSDKGWPLIDAMAAAGIPPGTTDAHMAEIYANYICHTADVYADKPDGRRKAAQVIIPFFTINSPSAQTFRQLAVQMYCPQYAPLPDP